MQKVALALPTISPLGGGVAEVARLHVAALDKLSLSVHTLDRSMDKVEAKGWSRSEVSLHSFYGPKSYSFAPGILASLFRAKPDIVHVHGVWQFQCMVVWIWSLVTGKPYVVTPHGMLEPWIRSRSMRLKAAVSALYQNRFLRNAAGFHLLTDQELNDIAEFRGGQPTEVIRNYVEPFSIDGARPSWWDKAFETRDIYLFLGRIHEKKGCLELCEAWDRISAADPVFRAKSQLIFCGWNDGLNGFEDRVAALGARHGNALFAGPQYGQDKNRSLAAARFFLLPSKSEGLPVAVLEAWAAGVPVLMSEECNLPIGFERDAAIRSGTTPETIIATLEKVSRMGEDQWQVISTRARELAASEFSVDRVRSALIALYEAAIEWKASRH